MTGAKKYFAQANKYLVAAEEFDLFEECKKALKQ